MEKDILSPLKAIRQHCISCAGRLKDVRLCSTSECRLHPFRQGRNPNRKGIGVGIRAKNGRFQAKIARLAGLSEKIASGESIDKAKTASGNLGALYEKTQLVPIKVEAYGKMQIHRVNKNIVITLSEK